MIKVQILIPCELCQGDAYVPVGEAQALPASLYINHIPSLTIKNLWWFVALVPSGDRIIQSHQQLGQSRLLYQGQELSQPRLLQFLACLFSLPFSERPGV